MENELEKDVNDVLSDEVKDTLSNLSEVELFFMYQEIEKQLESEHTLKIEMMMEFVVEQSKKFGVKRTSDKNPNSFNKWVKFWRDWQSKLTLFELQDILESIQLSGSYDEHLPKTKWNKNDKKS